MAAYSGKGAALYKDSYNLAVQSTAINLAWSCPVEEDTCFQDDAQTFVAGIPTWTLGITSNWRDASGSGTDIVYDAALGASGIYSFYPRGACPGYGGYGTVKAIGATYNPNAPVRGIITAEVNNQGSGELEHLRCLGASTSTNTSASAALTSHDYSASATSASVAGYLHVTTIAGTDPSVTFAVQESADDETFADLFSFTAITAAGEERATTSSSCARYARLKYMLNASTTSVSFAAGLHREE